MTHSFRPLSGREHPRFSGIKTFMRLPHHENPQDVDVMILGVPYDGLTSYRPGARLGPTAVRDACSLARNFHWESRTDVFDRLRVCDGGDIFVNILNRDETLSSIEKRIAAVAKAACAPLCIGGDHSVTLPILRALRQQHKKPLALFHIDAHADTYGPAWGEDLHHGTFVRHAVDEKLIDPKLTIQLGLRGALATEADFDYGLKKGFTVREAATMHTEPWDKTLKVLADWRKKVGTGPVYVSFDVDGVDPAFAPGTGTPVPGGLHSWQVLELLRALRGMKLAGADIVEIAPMYDSNGVTALLGMSAAFELLAVFADSRSE